MILIVAVFTLAGLLLAKYRGDKRLEWIFKPATSALFILTALVAGIDGTYSTLILIGLVGGFWGDVLLIPDSRQTFLVGLVVFLLGHVLYVGAFNHVVGLAALHPLGIILLVGVGSGVFFLLRPYLGTMQVPVLLYVGVITLMLIAALAVYFESDTPQHFRRLVAFGAVCFYLSDLGVALDRFVKPPFQQAYWSLPLYYAGQFMLALSVGEQ